MFEKTKLPIIDNEAIFLIILIDNENFDPSLIFTPKKKLVQSPNKSTDLLENFIEHFVIHCRWRNIFSHIAIIFFFISKKVRTDFWDMPCRIYNFSF